MLADVACSCCGAGCRERRWPPLCAQTGSVRASCRHWWRLRSASTWQRRRRGLRRQRQPRQRCPHSLHRQQPLPPPILRLLPMPQQWPRALSAQPMLPWIPLTTVSSKCVTSRGPAARCRAEPCARQMLKMGVPRPAVELKMQSLGLNPAVLDAPAAAPAARAAPAIPPAPPLPALAAQLAGVALRSASAAAPPAAHKPMPQQPCVATLVRGSRCIAHAATASSTGRRTAVTAADLLGVKLRSASKMAALRCAQRSAAPYLACLTRPPGHAHPCRPRAAPPRW